MSFQIVEVDNTVNIIITDSSDNEVSIISDGGVYRLSSIAKLLNSSGSQINPATEETLDSIKDTDGIKKIVDALPVGDNNIGRVKLTDGVQVADIVTDSQDGLNRLEIKGKVSVSAPDVPATATEVVLASDSPLEISTTAENSYTIPDGDTFTLTSLIAGAEGDPTEKGSKIEVIFDENGTEEIISRIYITGQTVDVYPNTSKSRAGSTLVGNAGGTNKIVLRRTRMSGSGQEVDAVIRGYVQ